MDNSSRNIVKFVAVITASALLIMAARFYAESQKEPMPGAASEAASEPADPESEAGSEPLPGAGELDGTEPEIIEEDAELKMGDPSVNLDQDRAPLEEPAPLSVPAPAETPQPEN